MDNSLPPSHREELQTLRHQHQLFSPHLEYQLTRLQHLNSTSRKNSIGGATRIAEKVEVLDIGCGPLLSLDMLTKLLPTARVTGLDSDTAWIEYVSSYKSLHRGLAMSLEDFLSSNSLQFDLVLCLFSASIVNKQAGEIASLVREGGYFLVHSFAFGAAEEDLVGSVIDERILEKFGMCSVKSCPIEFSNSSSIIQQLQAHANQKGITDPSVISRLSKMQSSQFHMHFVSALLQRL